MTLNLYRLPLEGLIASSVKSFWKRLLETPRRAGHERGVRLVSNSVESSNMYPAASHP